MLASLFRRLTAPPEAGAPLFNALTAKARAPHWYIEGSIPDTIDGRFAVLATLTAIALVRLEQEDGQGQLQSVALTERFVHVMESEHREIGLGDPGLGRQVRKLVGSLSRRVDLWREATGDNRKWEQTTNNSLYRGEAHVDSLAHAATLLKEFWCELCATSASDLAQGTLE